MKIKCSQLTAAGKPCRGWAMDGSDRCSVHARLVSRTVYTPELAERIVNFVRGGMHVKVVCAAVGLSTTTFYEWLQRGDADGRLPKDVVFREFRARVERARAEGEVALGMSLARAAREDPAWAAWLLERQFPERWARVSQRQGLEPDELAASSSQEGPEPDPFAEVVELAEQRRKRLREG